MLCNEWCSVISIYYVSQKQYSWDCDVRHNRHLDLKIRVLTQWNLIRFMNLSIMIRVAQHRNWFRKRPRRSWLSWLQNVLAMEIEVHIEPCRYGLLCDQINDLWTKDWFWSMINQLQNKEVMMGPDSIKWLDAIKSGIVSMYINQVLELDRPSERHIAYRT